MTYYLFSFCILLLKNKLFTTLLLLLDCTMEEHVRYGDNYRIQLSGVPITPPITLEYRPSAVEANQTSR